jgi:hypothetical protein
MFRIPGLAIRQVCTKFPINPLSARYSVKSVVSTAIFELFLSALKGATIKVTKANIKELSALCGELGFELNSSSYRLSQVEVMMEELKIDIGRISSEIGTLREIPNIKTQLTSEIPTLREMSEITTQLSNEVTQLSADLSSLRSWTVSAPVAAVIWDFLEGVSKFSLLWRGSRDGFGASQFHGRYDSHANSLTLIWDTNGNIFGGFPLLKRESLVWNRK